MKKDSHSPDRPAVTIIVTTYDRARLVPRAIDSVLRQTYPNVDLVVVDDGSRDDTSEVLAQYDDDPRVRIVRHDRNRGVTAAKNTGLLLNGLEEPDRLSELGRLGAALILQRAVEDELEAFLGRARYERTPEAAGSRNVP
jgi:glycosyltransferase involved in cell wall biosynthesis